MLWKGHQTGTRAVYLVAAELVGRGLIVSPTSRNAFGADLLVTNESCTRAYSVQVKANAGFANFWLLGKKAKGLASPTHIYVFVNGASGDDSEYYVVPSGVVKRRMREQTSKTGQKTIWYSFLRANAAKYGGGHPVAATDASRVLRGGEVVRTDQSR